MEAQLGVLQKYMGAYLGFLGEKGGAGSAYGDQGGMHLEQREKQHIAESVIQDINVETVNVMQGCMARPAGPEKTGKDDL